MGLLSDLIRNRDCGNPATAIPAMVATHAIGELEREGCSTPGARPHPGTRGDKVGAGTLPSPLPDMGVATAIPAIFAIFPGDESQGTGWAAPRAGVLPGIRADEAGVSTLAKSRDFSNATAAILATVATDPLGSALPPRLVATAVRVYQEINGDDDAAVQTMLKDLTYYEPAMWGWLTDYFEQQVAQVSRPPEPDRAVTCSECIHADYPNHPAITRCRAGVDSGLVTGGFWATDRHLCSQYEGKADP